MKKLIVILSAAALLLTGCMKDALQKGVNNEGDVFSFTVGLNSDDTKAVADNDGHAACVNHWVMEVLDADGERYNYQSEDGALGVKTHTFNVRLVKGQSYDVLFWADTKGYYNSDTLTNVFIKKAGEVYRANLDSLDAFSAVVKGFSTTNAASQNVTLKRPFAQMNIIFSDLDTLWKTMGKKMDEYKKFAPVDLKVTAKVPTTFNILSQEAGVPSSITMQADSNYLNNYAKHGVKETLFMNYLFATQDSKDVVDLAFSFTSKGTQIAHNLTSVPFQRNYRTNIIGDFMSSNAQWNVTIDPVWDGEFSEVVEIKDIKSANQAISDGVATGAKLIEVKFSSEPNDSGVPTGQPSSPSRALLTSNLKAGTTLSVEVMTNTKTLYVGDYATEYDIETMASDAKAAIVNINVPEGTIIGTLIINAPSKTVSINGKAVANVGTITNLDAIVSNNTLIIEENQHIGTLTIRQGGLEIHGTVDVVVVEVAQGKNVYVRDCEGLSQSVYDVLAPYIDIDNGYAGVKNGEKWDIVKGAAPVVAKIGNKNYYSLDAAFAAVTDGQTIELLANCSINATRAIDKTMTLDLGSKTLTANVSNAYVFEVADGKSFKITKGVVADGSNGASNGFAKASSGAVTINVTEVNFGVFNTSGTSNKMFPLTGGTNLVLTSDTLTTNNKVVESNGSNNTLTVTGGVYTDTKRNSGTHTFDLLEYDSSSAFFDGVTISSPDAVERQSCIETGTTKGSSSNIVLKDCTISAAFGNTVYCDSDVTIINCDIQTGSVSSNSYHALSVESEHTLNVYGGTIKSNSTHTSSAAIKIWTSGGIVNIYDTYDGESVPVKIEGYNMFYIDSNNKGEAAHKAEIHFNGENITTKGQWSQQHSAKAYVKGGYHEATVWSSSNANTFILSGGTFTMDPRTNNCFTIASGYTVAAQGTDPETWKVIVDPWVGKVARIGDVGYSTFQEACSAVKANETITLLENVTVPSNYDSNNPLSLNTAGVTLDLNNKTMTVTNNSAFVLSGSNIIVKNGNINAGAKTPTGTNLAPYNSYSIKSNGASNLKLQSLVMIGGMNLCGGSTVEISDCDVTAGEWGAICGQSGSTITVKSGTYTAREDYKASSSSIYIADSNNTTAIIEGGTFNGNPSSPKSNVCYTAKGGLFSFKTAQYWNYFNIPNGYNVIDKSEKIGVVYYTIKEVVKAN